MPVTRSLLLLLLSWAPVESDCLGRPLQYPEMVEYLVPYRVREMVLCQEYPDAQGNPQPCIRETGAGEWATPGTSILIDAQPDPPLGAVYDVQMPVAVNPAGRSDQC